MTYMAFTIIDLDEHTISTYIKEGWPPTFEFYSADPNKCDLDQDQYINEILDHIDMDYIKWFIETVMGNVLKLHDFAFVLCMVLVKSSDDIL